jgi:hypothetical protein
MSKERARRIGQLGQRLRLLDYIFEDLQNFQSEGLIRSKRNLTVCKFRRKDAVFYL